MIYLLGHRLEVSFRGFLSFIIPISYDIIQFVLIAFEYQCCSNIYNSLIPINLSRRRSSMLSRSQSSLSRGDEVDESHVTQLSKSDVVLTFQIEVILEININI